MQQQMLCDPDLTCNSRCNTAAKAIVLKAVISNVTSRGSALQKRLRDREKEMEADERDRKREKEELEEIRQRLLDEGHPDPDAELRRVRLCRRICGVCLPVCLCSEHAVCVVFVKVTLSSDSLCISGVQIHCLLTFFSVHHCDCALTSCISASYWSRWRRKRRSVSDNLPSSKSQSPRWNGSTIGVHETTGTGEGTRRTEQRPAHALPPQTTRWRRARKITTTMKRTQTRNRASSPQCGPSQRRLQCRQPAATCPPTHPETSRHAASSSPTRTRRLKRCHRRSTGPRSASASNWVSLTAADGEIIPAML